MLIASTSVAFTAAVIFYPALALDRARRRAVLVPLWTLILITPLLIPPSRPFFRLLASLLAVALSVKLYDLHVGAERGDRPDLRTFLLFLPNLASLVLRKLDAEPRPGRTEGLARLARAGLGSVIGTALLIATFHVDWHRIPFAVEHCTKVIASFLALVPVTAAGVGGWRLLGGTARDPTDNPFASRTPADFWRRYNRPAQQFLYEDLFRPLGGLHSPIRATLATFAISALIHEYVFDIAVGRIQGYQTVFFLVQGLAVVTTLGVKPKGWRAVPWRLGTWGFMLASSVLFFASLNEVVPFYKGRFASSGGSSH